MGEIADAMVNGDDCQECGTYIGEGEGIPRLCDECDRPIFEEDGITLTEYGKEEFIEIFDELQEVWEANMNFLQSLRATRSVGIRSSQVGALLIMAAKANGEEF